MTALAKGSELAVLPAARSDDAAAIGYELNETWWGYVVRPTDPPGPLQIALQAAASLLGAAAAAGALGLWALGPGDPDLWVMKLGASVVLGCISVLLLWFASRGDRTEIHVDTSLGEIREVVQSRAGRTSLIARHSFEAVGGIGLMPAGLGAGRGRCWLVLRLADGDELAVLSGPEASLRRLAERLTRDLARGSRKAALYEAVYPIERTRPS